MDLNDNHRGLSDEPTGATRWLRWVVDVRPGEVGALMLGFVYYFLLLSSYYVIRPIRDDMGVAGGLDNLPSMFTASMVTLLVINALFGYLVAKYTRRHFILYAYRFLILNLVAFVVLLTIYGAQNIWIGRVFFVWTSVFNLFVLSVFWQFMADVFTSEQGKRLFGFLSVGGTLGAIVGSLLTTKLVETVGPVKLMIISAVLIELSVQCVRRFPVPPAPIAVKKSEPDPDAVPVGGGFWNGIWHNFNSAYLLGISGYMLLYAFTSTVLYFQQASIAQAAFTSRPARIAFFGKVDLIVNIGTIIIQIFITGRLLKKAGVGATLAILPVLSVAGFLALGTKPTLVILILFLTVRRVGNFSLARPAREVLFTVITREDKYKAKNFIDTFVYRAGDQIGAWSYAGLAGLGLSMGAISFVAAPVAAVWLGLSIWLGRRQAAMARGNEPPKEDWQLTGGEVPQPAD
jgi:AAA family ATP:ADP antiporter